MEKYLEGVIARKSDELKKLEERNEKAETVEEVRSIGAQIVSVKDEIAEAKRQLATIGTEKVEERELNPVASYGMKGASLRDSEDGDIRSSMEYRKAFMEYVQAGRGAKPADILMRADAENVTGDLGILLPNTIVQSIMQGVEKVYGQVYSKVRKPNVRGGVQYPIGQFTDLKIFWDGTNGDDPEHGVSEKQKTGEITGYIQFTYHIGEIRIAQSLLQSVLTVPAFEAEVVKQFLTAYVRTMDEMILNGDGVHQPEGIFTELAKADSRIPASNVIEFNEDEMKDWKTWQKKLFAKVPLSMRKLRPEFLMTAETFESNILTLVDDNNRPLARETFNASTGDEKATFKAREVTFVEEGAIKSFDAAAEGEVFALYWVPSEAYLINFNQQFSYKKWFDEDKNQWVTKGLLICDGKVLDPKYIIVLKKGAKSASTDEPEVTA